LRGKGEEDVGKREGIDGGRFSLWRSGERGIVGALISASNGSGVEGGSDKAIPPISAGKKIKK
jgi:hypothetical protein